MNAFTARERTRRLPAAFLPATFLAVLLSGCAVERDRPFGPLEPEEDESAANAARLAILTPSPGQSFQNVSFTEGEGVEVRWEGSFQTGQELTLAAYRGAENQPFFTWRHQITDPDEAPRSEFVRGEAAVLEGIQSVSIHLRLWSTGGGLTRADSVNVRVTDDSGTGGEGSGTP